MATADPHQPATPNDPAAAPREPTEDFGLTFDLTDEVTGPGMLDGETARGGGATEAAAVPIAHDPHGDGSAPPPPTEFAEPAVSIGSILPADVPDVFGVDGPAAELADPSESHESIAPAGDHLSAAEWLAAEPAELAGPAGAADLWVSSGGARGETAAAEVARVDDGSVGPPPAAPVDMDEPAGIEFIDTTPAAGTGEMEQPSEPSEPAEPVEAVTASLIANEPGASFVVPPVAVARPPAEEVVPGAEPAADVTDAEAPAVTESAAGPAEVAAAAAAAVPEPPAPVAPVTATAEALAPEPAPQPATEPAPQPVAPPEFPGPEAAQSEEAAPEAVVPGEAPADAAEPPQPTVPPESPEAQARREFLKKALAVVAGGVAVGVPAAVALRVFTDPLGGKGAAAAEFLPVTTVDALKDEGRPYRLPVVADKTDAWNKYRNLQVGAVYLIRRGNQVTAFNVVCPHAGCPIDLAPAGAVGTFKCPCHDSWFKADGSLARGVSPRGMDQLDVDPAALARGEVRVRFQNFAAGTAKKVPVG